MMLGFCRQKTCRSQRKRREPVPVNTSETTGKKQRLTLVLTLESDLPVTVAPGADEKLKDRELSVLIISLSVALIASVFSLVICVAMCAWSQWRNAGSKGTKSATT